MRTRVRRDLLVSTFGRVAALLTSGREAASDALLLVAMIFVVFAVAKVALKPVTYIERIEVPKQLADRGYGSDNVSERLSTAVARVQDRSKELGLWDKESPLLLTRWADQELEVKIPGESTTVGELRKFIRGIFGVEDERVRGDIILLTKAEAIRKNVPASSTSSLTDPFVAAELVLRWKDGRSRASSAGLDQLEDMFQDSAENLLQQMDPATLAAYRMLSSTGGYELALTVVQECVSSSEYRQRLWGYEAWGIALLERGRAELARKEQEHAAKSFQDAANKFGEAIAEAASHGDSFPQGYKSLAAVYAASKLPSAALVYALEAAKLDGFRPQTMALLASIEIDLGNISGAKQHATQLVAKGGGSAALLNKLSMSLLQSDNPDDALHFAKISSQRNPRDECAKSLVLMAESWRDTKLADFPASCAEATSQ